MKNSFELQEIEVTGDELGDRGHTVAISKNREALEKYCEETLGYKVVTLSSINCPIREHENRVVKNMYYSIVESKVQII